MSLYRVKNLLDGVVYLPKNTAIYTVGSLGAMQRPFFSSRLSDIDLLVIHRSVELREYESYLGWAIRLRNDLSSKDCPVEIFMMSSSIVNTYIDCLPVEGGANTFSGEDLLFGNKWEEDEAFVHPSAQVRKQFYRAKARIQLSELLTLLPVADSSKMRKIAKSILRELKFIYCSEVSTTELDTVESSLFLAYSFDAMSKSYAPLDTLQSPIVATLQKALGGEVTDWSEWMVAQDEVAKWLLEADISEIEDIRERRLFTTLCYIRKMLTVGVKDIIAEELESMRSSLISEFIDSAASLMTRLALLDVDSLADFNQPTTPKKVKESYKLVTNHLAQEAPNLKVLAASIVLLEYGFQQSMLFANTLK